MKKQKHLNRWFWRWHIIGGLISLPIVLLLCITGIIYLFKFYYNNSLYESTLFVDPVSKTHIEQGYDSNYQAQLAAVRASTSRHVMQVILPPSSERATAFRLHSKGHSRDMVYVNPYTQQVMGSINQQQTLMYTVRKLHGELLLNTAGTWVVELVASWFIVLIVTGLYVWWPAKRFSLAGFFSIRMKQGRRLLWRDTHAVLGFWLSIFMLVILAGGMPWTDVFGDQLKWLQKQTNSGYPQYWRSSKGLKSPSLLSEDGALPTKLQRLSLDDVVATAQQKDLLGTVSIKIPMSAAGVFTVSNRAFWLRDQQVLHVDQYTGELVKSYRWDDVGILMELRQVAMRLHQGEYGLFNWVAILVITLLFTLASVAGLVSYLLRKPKGRWGFPEVPESFQVGYLLIVIVCGLGLLFPLFGGSVLLIACLQYGKIRKYSRI